MNLITGATGLIGARIAFDLLKRGERVRAILRKGSSSEHVRRIFMFYDSERGSDLYDQVEWVDGDILDPVSLQDAMGGVDRVIHSAAIVSFDPSEARKMISQNIEGAANVVNAMLETGVNRLAHVSSVAALGPAPEGQCADEECQWKADKARTQYAVSKHESEREVWRGAEEGLSVVILNPCITLGAGKKGQSSAMVFDIIGKKWPYYPRGTAGMVDVRNVSEALIELAFSSISNERFVIVGENLSYKRILEIGNPIYGAKPPEKPMPTWFLPTLSKIQRFASIFTGKRANLTRETVDRLNSDVCFSRKKLDKELSIDFIPVGESLVYFAPFYENQD